MKRNLLVISILIGMVIFFYPTVTISNGQGSPGGKSGSPGDNQASCADCHYAGIDTGATIITNIPATGYIPGQTYTITTTVGQANHSKFGFEITSEDNLGDKKGVFLITNSTETQPKNNNTAVTHTAGGTNGNNNSKTWSFDWIAPGFASSTGVVTFYGSFIAANGNNQNTGDTRHFTQLQVMESTGTNIQESNTTNQQLIITQNTIYTKSNINTLLIYDISGKLILTKRNLKENQIINLNKFSKSIYIAKCLDGQEAIISTQKFKIN